MKTFLKKFCARTRSGFANIYSRDFLKSMKDPTLEFLAGAAFLLFGLALIPLAAGYVAFKETRRNEKPKA